MFNVVPYLPYVVPVLTLGLGWCWGREHALRNIARGDETDTKYLTTLKRRFVLEAEIRVKQREIDRLY